MNLKLEYICTEAELKEAQKLNLHGQYGGGSKSKWRGLAAYWGFIALAAVGLYFRFKTEIAPKDRWWFIMLVVVIFIALQFFKRLTKRKSDIPVQVEISESGVVFVGTGRATMAWSAFSGCLESPTVFVLVSRSKTILYTLPKRAFPDEAAQNWFRTLANQPTSAAAVAGDVIEPGRFSAKGITLTVQMGFREYLTRMITSWRMKGIALGIMALIIGLCLFMPDQPDAVNSRGKTLLIMLLILIPMMTGVLLMVTVISWLGERKLVKPQHLALSSDGIEFADDSARGVLPWSVYKYYLENRWAFFIWHPQGSLWLMLPKRQFAAPSEVDQCRELLQANLQPSRWFYM